VPLGISPQGAEFAKKSKEMNLLKNLCVFAPLRETFSFPVYPGLVMHDKERSVIKKLFDTSFYKENSTTDAEVLDWYGMSPAERFAESQKLWELFISLGGNYDPEPDTQSPFYIF